jgi:acetoin utilization deacetylase AcuC-like enzyme
MRSRTAILRSVAFLQHDTGDHPERASRIIAIDCELERRHLVGRRPNVVASPAPDEAILRVHSQELLDGLHEVATAGGGWIDGDTVLRPESLDVARLAAGAALNAVDAIMANDIDRAFLIARPPGHHATPTRAMGFCLLNTAAIAAAHALARGHKRVAILDWDVHHGNGTQDIFYGRSDVLYISLHQSPLFPGTGIEAETGLGQGEGYTINIPLEAGTTDAQYLEHLRETVIPAIDAYQPDLVILSAGYDAHVEDPIGGMAVTDEGFRQMMREIVPVANRNGGKLLAVLEGGYNARALARCVCDAIEILDRIPVDAGSGTSAAAAHESEKSRII